MAFRNEDQRKAAFAKKNRPTGPGTRRRSLSAIKRVSDLDGLHTIGIAATKTAAGHYARGYNRVAGKKLARVVQHGKDFRAVVDETQHFLATGQPKPLPGFHTIGVAQTKTAAGHYVRGYNREARRQNLPATAHVRQVDGAFYAVVPAADHEWRR